MLCLCNWFQHSTVPKYSELSSNNGLFNLDKYWQPSLLTPHQLGHFVGPQGPHSHILMTRGSNRGSYFIPKKIPTSEFVYPKKSLLFLAYPKKIPQCFCISKFYYLSSGKLKHANFNFGFGQKQNYELRLCYF